mmetsp:Transcript_40267/g.68679  ORF Transcript_40267/g.68679 Transcript_40267/m.68679 type:complete len:242 (-) Transcript_40267:577-1302(-)
MAYKKIASHNTLVNTQLNDANIDMDVIDVMAVMKEVMDVMNDAADVVVDINEVMLGINEMLMDVKDVMNGIEVRPPVEGYAVFSKLELELLLQLIEEGEVEFIGELTCAMPGTKFISWDKISAATLASSTPTRLACSKASLELSLYIVANFRLSIQSARFLSRLSAIRESLEFEFDAAYVSSTRSMSCLFCSTIVAWIASSLMRRRLRPLLTSVKCSMPRSESPPSSARLASKLVGSLKML